jgi:Protein-L-isoaspartate(D-aspartate) O-methyltransferase (PCMT)
MKDIIWAGRRNLQEPMSTFLTRIKRSLAIRGVLGTVRVFGDKVSQYWSECCSPARRRANAIVRRRDIEFDVMYGLDTKGVARPSQSEVRGGNWIFGNGYQGVDPPRFVQTLSELSIVQEQFTFIDFGSGKGRAICLAMGFQFKKIIGIEYSEELCVIARRNVLSYQSSVKQYKDVDIVCGDAAESQIPDGPLVLFFNNPFGRPVMERVIHNVANSFQLNPRRIVIIYVLPEHMDLWDKVGFLSRTRASGLIAMYDTQKEGD